LITLILVSFISFSNSSHNKSFEFCKNPSIDEFPSDFLPFDKYSYRGVVLQAILTVYVLAAISIVCDEYFLLALDLIAKGFSIYITILIVFY
jgi:hypothetical protein